MTLVQGRLHRTDEVAVARPEVWEVVSDVDQLDRLLPDVRRYERTDRGWRWELAGGTYLGYRIQPAFTVAYEFDELEALRFAKVERGAGDTASAEGAFRLADAGDQRTSVTVELRVDVELSVPSLLRGTARAILDRELDRLAVGFVRNLRDVLDAR